MKLMTANPGVFRGLTNHASQLDPDLRTHSESKAVFKGVSKIIQNKILDCLLQIYRDQIRKEMKEAPFAAVMADDTTDVSEHTQMVIVLRYLLREEVVERFCGFFTPENQTADGLSKCILDQLNTVLEGNAEKLIAQTIDGASVMKEPHFFSRSPLRLNVLTKHMTSRIPRPSSTRWNFHSHTVNKCRDIDVTKAHEFITNFKRAISEIRNSKYCENPTKTLMAEAKEVCDCVCADIAERFSFTKQLVAAKLFNKDCFTNFKQKVTLEEVEIATEAYPMIAKERLLTELRVFYDRNDLHDFSKLSELLKIVNENNIGDVLCELTKLKKILLTMPMTTAEPERCFFNPEEGQNFLKEHYEAGEAKCTCHDFNREGLYQ
ncbi:uncharacterized protein LOC143023976 [Oratosquilla oratoria]|uniref:uncharacterized protein LOC143023976 n=1 Tax=Oratosquilla oratoria TaxID=337810 RepID=UPI003F76C015